MNKFNFESSAVQNYLSSIQTIINRMSSNSSSSKTWCITLVTAIIAFASDKDKPDSVLMALIPISLFFLLDAYYLGLEKQYVDLYNNFVNKVFLEEAGPKDIYTLTPNVKENGFVIFIKSAISVSVWPFYILITIMLFVLHGWIF
jgi:hypothetical protein